MLHISTIRVKRVYRFLHIGLYRGASSAGALHIKTITTEHLEGGGGHAGLVRKTEYCCGRYRKQSWMYNMQQERIKLFEATYYLFLI
jgi:hypothetical protein